MADTVKFFIIRGTRPDGSQYAGYGGHIFTNEAHAEQERAGAANIWQSIAFDLLRFDSYEEALLASRKMEKK